MDAIAALQTRRSHAVLVGPAPSDQDLRVILEAAAAGPDHGALRPFRFTLIRGAGAEAFGMVLEQAYRRRCAEQGVDPEPAAASKERSKLQRAPLVIAVAAARQPSPKIPWVDQRDAAVAAAMSILVAAHALGYGAMWRTGSICDDPDVMRTLGLTTDDAVVGFIYLGTPRTDRAGRAPKPPVDLAPLVTEYAG